SAAGGPREAPDGATDAMRSGRARTEQIGKLPNELSRSRFFRAEISTGNLRFFCALVIPEARLSAPACRTNPEEVGAVFLCQRLREGKHEERNPDRPGRKPGYVGRHHRGGPARRGPGVGTRNAATAGGAISGQTELCPGGRQQQGGVPLSPMSCS